jgi:hypothetical protein
MTTQAFSSSPNFPARSIAHKRPLFGLVPNKPHQNPAGAVSTEDGYTLAIVEFDDQGVCYDRRQMLALAAAVEALRGQGAVILVFVHGWTHNGSSNDDNLAAFRKILAQTALDAAGRPVLGVFVAWRGLSWYGPSWLPLEDATFFSRKEAALRVALGSVRELLGRLREFRVDESTKPNTPEPVLVIAGHSFGGLIVYSAVAQSLIEAAATPLGRVVPAFANLVLLVNPAFEAARYLPVFEQIENDHGFVPNQPPVFVSVTGQNDRATGCAFPIGETLGSLGESTRTRRERQALINTMGHLRCMLTHDLSAPGVNVPVSQQAHPGPAKSARRTNLVTSEQAEWTSSHGARLRRLPGVPTNNPFWNVRATPAVIDGHNGIFGDAFIGFVHDLVATHMAHTRSS